MSAIRVNQNYRLCPEIIECVRKSAKEQGKSTARIVEEILATHYGVSNNQPYNALNKEIETLKKELHDLQRLVIARNRVAA